MSEKVCGDFSPWKLLGHCKGQGDRGVEVPAADPAGDVDPHHDPDSKAPVDAEEAPVRVLA